MTNPKTECELLASEGTFATAKLTQLLGRQPAVGIVSMSPIADDPRVRRQGDALHGCGWKVKAFGQGAKVANAPDWPIETVDDANRLARKPSMPETECEVSPLRTLPIGLLKFAEMYTAKRGRYQTSYNIRLLQAYVAPTLAERIYWTLNGSFWNILALAREYPADLWLANDWTALPIAARVAAEQDAPYVYDAHELAADEFNEQKSWRYIQRPIRVETERKFIRKAKIVSTVSNGIAAKLQSIHSLDRTPLTIRSTPGYQKVRFRPTGKQVRVLYHGAVWEHRGLEECIRSVASWRPEFNFTIRGPISESYRCKLVAEISSSGVHDRVHIVPPVPMVDLVTEASASDVGLFALPGHSAHNKYALPNKFFEYTMAGLSLCMSDLPEMSDLIRKYRHGTVFRSISPAAISSAMNALTPDSIDQMKRNSLKAAEELCWERESRRMIEAYASVVRPSLTAVGVGA